ncbi:MAG TPA: hypothetical protein VEB86_11520, partial [Chryseosolibacter sp.]|nr:hypothetical protein [Chryseosolibacter sp.]
IKKRVPACLPILTEEVAGLKALPIVLNESNNFKRYDMNAILGISDRTGNPVRIFADGSASIQWPRHSNA